LEALFNELFDAVLAAFFTELLDAVLAAFFTELLDAIFMELFVDDLAAPTLPREPPLLTSFDLEGAFAPATFGRLGVDDLAVFGCVRGAAVSTASGLSMAAISALCTAAGASPLLVELDSDSSRAASASPRTSGAFAWRFASTVEVESVQTFAPSFQSMPALPQSAFVSGWLEASKRRWSLG
jgi:hypothetical protein